MFRCGTMNTFFFFRKMACSIKNLSKYNTVWRPQTSLIFITSPYQRLPDFFHPSIRGFSFSFPSPPLPKSSPSRPFPEIMMAPEWHHLCPSQCDSYPPSRHCICQIPTISWIIFFNISTKVDLSIEECTMWYSQWHLVDA